MPKYDFSVPPSRDLSVSAQAISAQAAGDACEDITSETNRSVCARDVILHMLVARVATIGEETEEFRSVFDAATNTLDIEVRDDILQTLETITLTSNLQRFLAWITSRPDLIDEVSDMIDDAIEEGAVLKADKVTSAVAGNLAALDATGNLTDSGKDPDECADKVTSAVAGNLAALDATGNLTDSGKDPDEYADKVTSAVAGNFASLSAIGDLADSGKSSDDYYIKTEIDALSYEHQGLSSLQGGNSGERYHFTSAEHTNLTGDPEFDKITLNNAPTSSTDAATKAYVDAVAAGASAWLDAVDDFHDPTAALPVGPTLGDRYIALDSGNGWTVDNVYEYNGATWDETVVAAGNSTYVDAEDSSYIFNGTDWVKSGGISDHNSLSGIQGGDDAATFPEHYHLTATARAFAESVEITTGALVNNQRLVYDSIAGKWENKVPSVGTTLVVKIADYTITASDSVVVVDASSSAVVITLPTASGIIGREYTIKCIDTTNTVTIVCSGSETIDNETLQNLSTWGAIKVISDGTNWLIV